MNSKEYKFTDGRTAVFEYDENGIGKITLECMDALMGMTTQQWIPFRQRKNPVTELFEWDEPLPKEGQHILVTISMRGHEPVQDDYWYVDGTICYLDSGYDIGTEAVAWMPLPPAWKGE